MEKYNRSPYEKIKEYKETISTLTKPPRVQIGEKYDEYLLNLATLYEKMGDQWVKQVLFDNSLLVRISDLNHSTAAYQTAKKYLSEMKFPDKAKIDRLTHLIKKAEETIGNVREKNMSSKLMLFMFVSFIFTLILVSSNFTGNAIGGLSLNDSKWLALCFFICGLIFAFIYLKNKKND